MLSLHVCFQAKPPGEPPKDVVSALLLAGNGYEVASLKPAFPLIRELYQALLIVHTQTCQYSWAPEMQGFTNTSSTLLLYLVLTTGALPSTRPAQHRSS